MQTYMTHKIFQFCFKQQIEKDTYCSLALIKQIKYNKEFLTPKDKKMNLVKLNLVVFSVFVLIAGLMMGDY